MAEPKESEFGTDNPDAVVEDEFEQLTIAFQAKVDEFAREHDLSTADICELALRLGVVARMLDYVESVEEPSGSGLKRELDRLVHDLDDSVRGMKKNADAFVAMYKQELAKSEADEKGQ